MRPHPRVRSAAALLLGVAGVLLLAVPVGAQTIGPCVVFIDEHRLGDADSPDRAIPIDADAVASVVGQSLEPVTRATVAIGVWPTTWTIADEPIAPTTEWSGSLRVADYARFGSGLYEVTASTDACEVHGWVKVTGRSPLETPAGLVSIGIIVLGVLLAVRAFLTAGRGNGWLAVVGGVVFGIGLLLFAQQSGVTGITPTSAILWTAIPGTISGVLNQVVGGLTQAEPRPEVPVTAGGATVEIAGATIGSEPDPPRTTYARLSSPDAVVAEQAFDLVVGLADRPDPRVGGEPLHRPASSVGAYTMTIQLVADGLRLADPGASWRIDLPVTADAPYPAVTLQLVADAQTAPVLATSIRAMYSIDGNPIGLAVRSVAVVRSADLLATAPAQPPRRGRRPVAADRPGRARPDRADRTSGVRGERLAARPAARGRSVDRHAGRAHPHRHRRRPGGGPAADRRRDAGGGGSPDAVRGVARHRADHRRTVADRVLGRPDAGRRTDRRPATDDPVPLGRAVRAVGARGRGPAARSRPPAVPRVPRRRSGAGSSASDGPPSRRR